MKKPPPYCPEPAWWAHAGERLCLGLGIREALSESIKSKGNRVTAGLSMLVERIQLGEPLLLSFRRSGMQLSLEDWCLLEAGERTGRFGEAMIRVGESLAKASERRRDLVGRMWYPLVVAGTGLLVMGILVLRVVPEMRALNQSMARDARLPWITEHIGSLYCGLLVFGLVILAMPSAGIAFLRLMGRRRILWAQALESFSRRVPLYGWLRFRRRQARFLRQLGSLLEGGINITEALHMMAQNAPDEWERRQILDWRDRLVMGTDFTRSMDQFPVIRKSQHSLIVTGQECGKLDAYLLKLAEEVESSLNWRLDQWIRALEPLTVVALAVAVGGLVLAYLMPMIQMLERLA